MLKAFMARVCACDEPPPVLPVEPDTDELTPDPLDAFVVPCSPVVWSCAGMVVIEIVVPPTVPVKVCDWNSVLKPTEPPVVGVPVVNLSAASL